MKKVTRVGAIEVTINLDLSVSYRITLPLKEQHLSLFPRDKIKSYIRGNSIRYMFVHESEDRMDIHRVLTAAQVEICSQKIKDLKIREEVLLQKLSNKGQSTCGNCN